MIQPTTISTGTKAMKNVPADRRRRSPFVQPPMTCEIAVTRPAPATIPISAQKRPSVRCPTSVAAQSRTPAAPAAASVVRPRVASYSPYRRIRSPRSAFVRAGRETRKPPRWVRSEAESACVEGRGPELGPELLHCRFRVPGEDVLDDADLAIVVERHVDVLVADEIDRRALAHRAVDGEPEPAGARREQEERRREHGPRAFLGVTEEAPRPLPRADVRSSEVTELVPD